MKPHANIKETPHQKHVPTSRTARTKGVRWRAVLGLCALWLVAAGISIAATTPRVKETRDATGSVYVRPEYERELLNVLISFPDGAGRSADGLTPRGLANSQFVYAAHQELLLALPQYTQVDVIVQETNIEAVLQWDHLFRVRDNVHLHIVRNSTWEVDLWTQDLGEAVYVDGFKRLLVSAPPDGADTPAKGIAHARTEVARKVFGPVNVIEARFVFEGGNVLFDRVGGRLRALVGESVVRDSAETARRQGRSLSEGDAIKQIARGFGVLEAVVLRGTQPRHLPHIDQAFVLLRGQNAVIQQISDSDSAEGKLLRSYREQLERLGYRTLPLEVTLDDVKQYRTSVNAIPFYNRETKTDTVIFPVFPGEVKDGAPTVLKKKHLLGKALAAYELFLSAGYEPLPIRDVAHVVGGNAHCITNAIE